jgi:hypothetical protein
VVLRLRHKRICRDFSVTIKHVVISLKVVIVVRELTHRVHIVVEAVMVLIDNTAFMSVRQFPLLMMSQAVFSRFMMGNSVACGDIIVIVSSLMVERLCVVFTHHSIIVYRLLVFLDEHSMVKVMKWLTSSVILVNHMVLFISIKVMLSYRGVRVDDLRMMAHVRGRMMNLSLSLVMRMLVVNDRLVMQSFIVIFVTDWLLNVMVWDIAMGRMLNAVILMEIMKGAILSLIVIVVVDLVSVIQLSVSVVIETVLGRVLVLFCLMLIASVLRVMIAVSGLVELGSVMQVTVIRVHVFDQGLVMVDLFPIVMRVSVVRLRIEAMRLIGHFAFNHDIMMVVSILMFQEILLLGSCIGTSFFTWIFASLFTSVGKTHTLSIAWHKMTIQFATVGVEISMCVPSTFGVVLRTRLIECLLHLESFVKGVGLLRWELLGWVEDVLWFTQLSIMLSHQVLFAGVGLMVDGTSFSGVSRLKIAACVNSSGSSAMLRAN